MEVALNQIIDYFANATLQYIDVITNKMQPNEWDGERTTAKGVCGLVIPLSGMGNFTFNGKVYRMEGNMIVHAGSAMNIELQTIGDSVWEYAVVHYKYSDGPDHCAHLAKQHFPIYVGENPKIQLLVQQLLKQQSIPGNMSVFQSKVLFANLLETILLGARTEQYESKSEVIAATIEYIHEHYAEEIFVAQLAERFGMERRRFSYFFERFTGLAPIHYITEYRMRRAMDLLKSSHYSIAKIAESIGYQDSFYFSRVFKKHVHMSPSQYRKQCEKNSIYF